MQSLNDYCFGDEEDKHSSTNSTLVSICVKMPVEIVAMLCIIATGTALTLLGAPVLLFLK